MKNPARIFLNMCLVLSITVTAVQSAEKYVTTTGSNSPGGGTQENPWATIKYALSRVSGSVDDPVTICVAQGTYYEYEISMKPYVSIYGGYDPSTWERNIIAYQTIVDGQYGAGSDPDIFNGADNAVLDGLTIQNSTDDGVDCNTKSPTITNCHILQCIKGNGRGIAGETGVPIIRNNIIEGNRYGIESHLQSLGTVIIENNLIIGSITYGIYVSSNARIINNTIDNNISDNIYVGSGGTAVPTMLIQNNNITRSHSDGIYISTSILATGITINYNNVWANQSENYRGLAAAGKNDISQDPRYVLPLPQTGSSTDYDYHLKSNSPSRDKGTNDGAPEDDLDGNPRPRDGKTDIGCYEYQPPPPTPTPQPPPPPPPFEVRVNSNSLSTGGPFRVDVTVPPCGQAFDAWGVIKGQGVLYSFVLNKPGQLRRGAAPLIQGVSRLSNVYEGCLCNLPAIPAGAEGQYSVIVGLVSTGVKPRSINDTLPGYADQEQVTVGQ
ncbi:MAG: right-handed parallel beta-helix repeat-containing protein [Candidatus Aureabacteria bacterium]|nr:right-handed parallel beta-helix repeat-containing protein [Candidatus Auribacterota bacterium]